MTLLPAIPFPSLPALQHMYNDLACVQYSSSFGATSTPARVWPWSSVTSKNAMCCGKGNKGEENPDLSRLASANGRIDYARQRVGAAGDASGVRWVCLLLSLFYIFSDPCLCLARLCRLGLPFFCLLPVPGPGPRVYAQGRACRAQVKARRAWWCTIAHGGLAPYNEDERCCTAWRQRGSKRYSSRLLSAREAAQCRTGAGRQRT
ncbi:hypothetical protein K438DRAFT_1006817 [Mycena galopus ATCC 62051]|nr:hypothetical protein K438DRAFT_1006817 [Mycena galopus ATCC 62051]